MVILIWKQREHLSAATINILVYAEYNNVIETYSNRNESKIGTTSDEHLQLAEVLTKDPFTKASFAGVYACDQ